MARKWKKVVYKWVEYDSSTEVSLLKLLEELEQKKLLKILSTRPEWVVILSEISSNRIEDEKVKSVLSKLGEFKDAKKVKDELVYTPDFLIKIWRNEYTLEVKTKWGLAQDKAYVIRRKLFLQRYPETRFIECVWVNKKEGWKFKKYF